MRAYCMAVRCRYIYPTVQKRKWPTTARKYQIGGAQGTYGALQAVEPSIHALTTMLSYLHMGAEAEGGQCMDVKPYLYEKMSARFSAMTPVPASSSSEPPASWWRPSTTTMDATTCACCNVSQKA